MAIDSIILTIIGSAFGLMFTVWMISVPLMNVSIIDIFWGFGFVLIATVLWLAPPLANLQVIVTTLLIAIWGLRLTWHIGTRNMGKGEDYRYVEIREKYGDKFWWLSLFIIFWVQAGIMVVVAAPLVPIHMANGNQLHTIQWLGILVWLVGFIFEAGGDWQLKKFKADPANKGKLLTTGLWSLTRHPNYFGDATQWWGIFIIACGVPYGWATIFSPVVMTLFLMKYTGAGLLEKRMQKVKPGYEEYIANTPMFFPRIFRKK